MPDPQGRFVSTDTHERTLESPYGIEGAQFKLAARIGQLEMVGGAVHQTRRHLALQLRQRARQRWLRYVKALGSASQVLLVSDRKERPQVTDFHGHAR